MKEIKLTKEKIALVDDEDFERVNQYKWYVNFKGKNVKFYAARRPNQFLKLEYLHNYIMQPPVGLVVDHISGDSLDNRRCNLRICTKQQNDYNTSTRSDNTSGYKGVAWHKASKKWAVNIMVNGKTLAKGLFENKDYAAGVYDIWAIYYFGNYAKTNKQQKENNYV